MFNIFREILQKMEHLHLIQLFSVHIIHYAGPSDSCDLWNCLSPLKIACFCPVLVFLPPSPQIQLYWDFIYPAIHSYNSMAFNKYIHPSLQPIYHAKKRALHSLAITPPLSLPALGSHWSAFCLCGCACSGHFIWINDAIQYTALGINGHSRSEFFSVKNGASG